MASLMCHSARLCFDLADDWYLLMALAEFFCTASSACHQEWCNVCVCVCSIVIMLSWTSITYPLQVPTLSVWWVSQCCSHLSMCVCVCVSMRLCVCVFGHDCALCWRCPVYMCVCSWGSVYVCVWSWGPVPCTDVALCTCVWSWGPVPCTDVAMCTCVCGQAIHEDEDEKMEEGVEHVTKILGHSHIHLYPSILQLVMADGVFTEGGYTE